MATFNYPTAEAFADAVFGKLADAAEFGRFDWDYDVSPDGIIRFTDMRTGNEWSVAIDDTDGDAGESMWVNVCEGTMNPDFEPLEFSSVDAAVNGVATWLTAADAK